MLKAEERFAALPVAASRAVKLGGTVATIQMKNERDVAGERELRHQAQLSAELP